MLERIRERQEGGSEQAELEERRASLEKRLREVEAELDRLVALYAGGQIDAKHLSAHVRDRENKIENLKLLLGGVENDLAAAHESQAEAKSAASWLVTLASRVEEVEANTEEALEKRRELIRLLVEKITVGRDENDRVRVRITYRFGPPAPPEEGDDAVYGDNYASAFLTTRAFCSALKRDSGSSRYSWILPRSSESNPTTSQEVGTKAVALAYSRASSPYGSKHL